MSDAKARLDRVYQAADPLQLRESYEAWAAHYDSDLVGQMGWDKPERVGRALLDLTGPGARILDAGSGTGLVGLFLSTQGYQDITGVDFSEAMIEQARRRGVYRELLRLDLNQDLPLPTDHFDAAVAVGIFTEGHVNSSCLIELVRVVRPAGYILFSLRDDLLHFESVQAELNAWSLVERKRIGDGLEGRAWSIWIYQKVSS